MLPTWPCPHPHCDAVTRYKLGGCYKHLLALPLPIRDDITRARLGMRGTWRAAMAKAVAWWEANP